MIQENFPGILWLSYFTLKTSFTEFLLLLKRQVKCCWPELNYLFVLSLLVRVHNPQITKIEKYVTTACHADVFQWNFCMCQETLRNTQNNWKRSRNIILTTCFTRYGSVKKIYKNIKLSCLENKCLKKWCSQPNVIKVTFWQMILNVN